MGGYTNADSGQRLGKHIPAATDTNATVEELCFQLSPCRDISKGQGQLIVNFVRECVKRDLEPQE
jgi:hypothetical protein